MGIHCGRFGWRMLPIWLLPAALCKRTHKRNATNYWWSKRSPIWKKKNLCWENSCQMKQKTWLKCMIVKNNPWVQLFWIQNWKCPSFSILICWKLEYKQSLKPNDLKPNDLKGIKLYSSHSVACPTSHLAEGQTQLQLYLYTTTFIFF